MVEFLKEFFFNAGVFKGTVRAVLIGGGVAIAALPESILGDAPSWLRIGGVVLVALGGFLRSTQQPLKTYQCTISVNGEKKVTTAKELSYGDVVELAFPDSPNFAYSVTHSRARGDKPDGILLPGGTVKIKDGTIFNVADTSSA
jgi:hypothetical protein